MNIVITDANTPQALAAIRELGKLGHTITAIAPEEGKRAPLGLSSKYAAHTKTFPPGLAESAYQDWLLDRLDNAKELFKPVLLPTGPKTLRLVAKRKIEFRLACEFLAPNPEQLQLSFDKRLLYKAAEAAGIAVPQNIAIPDGENLRKISEELPYPVALKYWGGEKLGLPPRRRYTITNNPNEFAKRYNNMYDVQSPVLVQPKLNGKSYGVSVLMDAKSRPVRIMTHERIRQLPLSGGPGTLVRSVWREDLAQAAVKLLSALKWEGFAMLEFVADENTFTLVDLNARLWNSFPLSGVCGGRLAETYALAANQADLTPGIACRYTKNVKMQYLSEDLRASVLMGPKAFIDCIKTLCDKNVKGGIHDKTDKAPSKVYFKSMFRKSPPEPW